jgi:hypothetical protein
MSLVRLVEVGFALGIVVTAAAVAAASLPHVRRFQLVAAVAALALLAISAWIAFAFRSSDELALAAGGLTVCLALTAAAVRLQRALARGRRMDDELSRAEERLRQLVADETAERAAELERVLARSRADSISLLNEEERRIGEERRRSVAERERESAAELAETLAAAQRRVESRLAGWAEDLERAQQHLTAQLTRLGERQRQLIVEAEARIAADVERLEAGSEDQRAVLAKLREELGRAAEQIVANSAAELEAHAGDRRRALHELGERLRRRERELAERIEREEGEAAARIRSGLADIERRAIETLERAVDRTVARYSEEASQQFVGSIKAAREDAARRLSRELDRAVETFSREASSVLAERLAHVADAGAQRVEKRMNQIGAGLERQREELVGTLEQRLTQYEEEMRRQVQALVTDVDSERAVLQARLQELGRRIDELAAHGRDRLVTPSSREP